MFYFNVIKSCIYSFGFPYNFHMLFFFKKQIR